MKRFRKAISKLCCVVCAVGTYIMAFMTADIFKRDIPFDIMSGAAIVLFNITVLYMFIVCGFDLANLTADDEEKEPVITAEGFCTDFYETYFTDEEAGK